MPALTNLQGLGFGDNPPPGAYGSLTQTAGTPIIRPIPPRSKKRARVDSFFYKAGANAHILTVMPALRIVTLVVQANSGQKDITLPTMPTLPSGDVLANTDYITYRLQDGSWTWSKIASISGNVLTLVDNILQNIITGRRIFIHGSAADHVNRQFSCPATTEMRVGAGDGDCGSADDMNESILVIVDNVTAAGTLFQLAYSYGNE